MSKSDPLIATGKRRRSWRRKQQRRFAGHIGGKYIRVLTSLWSIDDKKAITIENRDRNPKGN
jgi:hypothetical protein